ncbi:MAG: restriction endonuclease subunit M [Bacteroidales bacterium]|jgi:hypothetical protein|nr:restriction endonuclease subunit M [Bacteroidales bacterium]MCI2133702.1 restriction endonuclease subunit M [Bacteroidales bacterium]
MSNEVDILENDILKRDPALMEFLLIDHSRPKQGKKHGHIIWATDNYEPMGDAYRENTQISIESITGENGGIVQPRVKKTKAEQQSRARDKGEVFTPSWICNRQNNLVDNEWFGFNNAFNEETDEGWITKKDPVSFPTSKGFTWQDYVSDTRLEITCGEAPYLISRYDTITGEIIPVHDRIGLLDRKLRVVAENTASPEEWFEWVLIAYQNIYAYEWQGDNLLLARENALYTFDDNYKEKFGVMPTKEMVRKIAEIISWNFWQMDGLKGVIPNTCHDDVQEIPSLFGDSEKVITPCPGCRDDNYKKHNGIYCKIMDWRKGKAERYIDSIKL